MRSKLLVLVFLALAAPVGAQTVVSMEVANAEQIPDAEGNTVNVHLTGWWDLDDGTVEAWDQYIGGTDAAEWMDEAKRQDYEDRWLIRGTVQIEDRIAARAPPPPVLDPVPVVVTPRTVTPADLEVAKTRIRAGIAGLERARDLKQAESDAAQVEADTLNQEIARLRQAVPDAD